MSQSEYSFIDTIEEQIKEDPEFLNTNMQKKQKQREYQQPYFLTINTKKQSSITTYKANIDTHNEVDIKPIFTQIDNKISNMRNTKNYEQAWTPFGQLFHLQKSITHVQRQRLYTYWRTQILSLQMELLGYDNDINLKEYKAWLQEHQGKHQCSNADYSRYAYYLIYRLQQIANKKNKPTLTPKDLEVYQQIKTVYSSIAPQIRGNKKTGYLNIFQELFNLLDNCVTNKPNRKQQFDKIDKAIARIKDKQAAWKSPTEILSNIFNTRLQRADYLALYRHCQKQLLPLQIEDLGYNAKKAEQYKKTYINNSTNKDQSEQYFKSKRSKDPNKIDYYTLSAFCTNELKNIERKCEDNTLTNKDVDKYYKIQQIYTNILMHFPGHGSKQEKEAFNKEFHVLEQAAHDNKKKEVLEQVARKNEKKTLLRRKRNNDKFLCRKQNNDKSFSNTNNDVVEDKVVNIFKASDDEASYNDFNIENKSASTPKEDLEFDDNNNIFLSGQDLYDHYNEYNQRINNLSSDQNLDDVSALFHQKCDFFQQWYDTGNY